MPTPKNGLAIKKEVLQLIADNIGTKTAEMYRDFYDANKAEAALNSAEELLAEFVGRQKAAEQVRLVRTRFNLDKVKAV